jgi:hypothetical protein
MLYYRKIERQRNMSALLTIYDAFILDASSIFLSVESFKTCLNID